MPVTLQNRCDKQKGTFHTFVSKHFSGARIVLVENCWTLLSGFLEGAIEQIPWEEH